ncbi:MAG: divalent metal cation transporter [Myxococcota bacterium]
MPAKKKSPFLRAFGPGLLFAGQAVGVSHLVQSTRAGADYGLALVFIVIAAHVLKYPAFRFGPHYATVTGTSLLEGYRRQGRWALGLYTVVIVLSYLTSLAAITLVTAGVTLNVFGVDGSPLSTSGILLFVSGALIATGGYLRVEALCKLVVPALAVCTVIATAFAIPALESPALRGWPEKFDVVTLGAAIALMGWMPTPIDSSLMHSLWVIARRRHAGETTANVSSSSLDFDVGYVGTALLAICFVIMGAAVMFGTGEQFSPIPAIFAGQVIDLYAQSIGPWSRPLVGFTAFLVMFTTLLTVVEGLPRVIATVIARFSSPEPADATEDLSFRRVYWIALSGLGAGSLVVIAFFMNTLGALVDVATISAFVLGPAIAWLNHRAVTSDEVPIELRPAKWLIGLSGVGIAFMGALAAVFLIARFLT